MKSLKFIGFLVFLALAVILVKVFLFPAHIAEKVVNTAYDVVDKALTADNVIYNYEWFKQQYEDYKAIQSKIKNAEESVARFEKSAGPRDKWTFEDKNEFARLSSIVDGLRYKLEDIRATYNARSKMVNRSIFKDHNLPETL